MQRRNQIIFTSSRASSRRCWPHTLLHRSGPRKDSREKKKGSQRTLPPKMRTRNRRGDLERDFERGVVSPERNLKRQPKNRHHQTQQVHVNACECKTNEAQKHIWRKICHCVHGCVHGRRKDRGRTKARKATSENQESTGDHWRRT